MSLLVLRVLAAEAVPAVRAGTAAAEPMVMTRDLFNVSLSREARTARATGQIVSRAHGPCGYRHTTVWLPRTSVLPDARRSVSQTGRLVQIPDRSFERMLKSGVVCP